MNEIDRELKRLDDRDIEVYLTKPDREEWLKTLFISERELIQIFSPEINKIVESKLAEYKEALEILGIRLQEQINKLAIELADNKEAFEFESDAWYVLNYEPYAEHYEKTIKRLERLMSMIKRKKTPTNEVTEEDIQLAKAVPIETLLEFNRAGFAHCLWHNEKTPSMKLYKSSNHVHCFGGCGKTADSIDVIMQIQNLDFLNAVRYLLGK